MNVRELKEKLSALPDNMLVVVDGYESGFAETVYALKIFFLKNMNGEKDGIYGRHGCHWPADKPDPRADGVALFIGEGRNLLSDDYE